MNRRTICLLLPAFIFLFSTTVFAQEEDIIETQMLDKLYLSKFITEKGIIVSDALQKIFSGTFFKVNAGFAYPDQDAREYCSINTMAILGGKAEIVDPSGNNLLTYIRKDFVLNTEEGAVLFEAALDQLFPIIMDEGVKAHRKIDKKWYFIRSNYLEDKTAYIVTLDANSKITGIIYDEHAIKAK
jgi:uncharacterized protein YxjI